MDFKVSAEYPLRCPRGSKSLELWGGPVIVRGSRVTDRPLVGRSDPKKPRSVPHETRQRQAPCMFMEKPLLSSC